MKHIHSLVVATALGLVCFHTSAQKVQPQAQGLCASNEEPVFSCKLQGNNSRTASLCASPASAQGEGSFRYRYGRLSKIELEYPVAGNGSDAFSRTLLHFAGSTGGYAFSFAAHAQDRIVRVQTLQDAWQVRRAETRALITAIGDEKATQEQHASALRGFDARLTAAEKGELTPMETMELFQVFYIPKALQQKPPRFDTTLRIIAAQATMGWYDALRFADDSGQVEISSNEAFFTFAFDKSTRDFVRFMKEQPDQAAAAVKAGIQDARDKIAAKHINYDPTWPASYGMLRMQCAMTNAKTCEVPAPRPAGDWPALLDQAAQRVTTIYRAAKGE